VLTEVRWGHNAALYAATRKAPLFATADAPPRWGPRAPAVAGLPDHLSTLTVVYLRSTECSLQGLGLLSFHFYAMESNLQNDSMDFDRYFLDTFSILAHESDFDELDETDESRHGEGTNEGARRSGRGPGAATCIVVSTNTPVKS
jgi:hypothetical protein